jgi:hypothetical protein
MTTKKYYTGIGSRKTPVKICHFMTELATKFEKEEHTLRTGGANGADKAFIKGVKDPDNMQIFVPTPGWHGFEMLYEIPEEAYELAKKFHPAWNRCSPWAKSAHARNMMQVLGPDLKTPSSFVVFWAPYYTGTYHGGTSQALRIAEAESIHCYKVTEENELKLVEW